MGQYYRPTVVDQHNNILFTAYSHEFDSGLKLLEHSWIGNDFVQAFETLLVADGPVRVVWAGDYADPETDAEGNPLKVTGTDGNEYDANLYTLAALAKDKHYRPDVPAWNRQSVYNWIYANGRRREKPKITYAPYDEDLKPNAFPEVLPTMTSHPYLLNHDKGLAVDKRRVPKDANGWRIHPLPLLTVEGNGRGGGDFHVDPDYFRTGDNRGNFDLIGSWSRDRISLSKTLPKGFERTDFDLVEG
ncbi:hypothetical protein SEA_INTERFOLIA_83 [Mycobacterium phage InterFolia]|nr:hypothetical protein SEA_INTERFOLIA_83 [Mycobacterium phage InterFolia]UTN92564.1 hypothetical protein SEA_MIKRO_72 [Mycobacterium phage Mikro]